MVFNRSHAEILRKSHETRCGNRRHTLVASPREFGQQHGRNIMKKTTTGESAFSISRLLAYLLCLLSFFLALLGITGPFGRQTLAQGRGNSEGGPVQVGASYHNDVSLSLRDMPAWSQSDWRRGGERDANENPKVPYRHINSLDPVAQNAHVFAFGIPNI